MSPFKDMIINWWLLKGIMHIFKKNNPGNYRPLSIASVSWKVADSPWRSFKLRKDKMIGRIQHGFIKGKPHLTELIDFCCNEMIAFMGKERILDVVWNLGMVSHSILVAKLVEFGLDKKNWSKLVRILSGLPAQLISCTKLIFSYQWQFSRISIAFFIYTLLIIWKLEQHDLSASLRSSSSWCSSFQTGGTKRSG